jgi:hypothetical protein
MVYMSTNAREFLNEIADMLRAQGREVTIEESTHGFGTMAWLQAVAPNWYDATINVSAVYSTRTNRWSLGDMKIRRSSDTITATTRSRMKTAVSVYAY